MDAAIAHSASFPTKNENSQNCNSKQQKTHDQRYLQYLDVRILILFVNVSTHLHSILTSNLVVLIIKSFTAFSEALLPTRRSSKGPGAVEEGELGILRGAEIHSATAFRQVEVSCLIGGRGLRGAGARNF